MLRVGLTGGAGSGKSTVARGLERRGFVGLDADRIAHELYAPGSALADAIVQAFGPEVRDGEGKIDRRVLGRRVFARAEERQRLDALVHPPLVIELERRLDALAASGVRVAVLEAALLLQWNASRLADLVVGVVAPREVRVARLEAAGLSAREARQRVDAQAEEAGVRARADLLVENAGTPEALEMAIEALARELRSRAGIAEP